MTGGQSACSLPKFTADRVDAAFSLNGFEDDGANRTIEFRLEIAHIVKPHKFNTGNQGSEGVAVFRVVGD